MAQCKQILTVHKEPAEHEKRCFAVISIFVPAHRQFRVKLLYMSN